MAYYFRYRDPLHEREEAVFAALDYVDIQYLVDRIQAEVIWAMGLEDRVCHPKTQFAVYNHIQAPKNFIFTQNTVTNTCQNLTTRFTRF